MDPSSSSGQTLGRLTILRWSLERKPLFSRRALVYLLPQLATSSETLREIMEEDASIPSFAFSLKRLSAIAGKQILSATVAVLAGFSFLWAVGAFLRHPRWLAEFGYGFALNIAIRAVASAVSLYLLPSHSRHKPLRDIKNYAIQALLWLMYALACPSTTGFVHGAHHPTYLDWLSYYLGMLLNGVSLGFSGLLLPKFSTITPATTFARVAQSWFDKLLALGIISTVTDAIWDAIGYSKEFEGTIDEFRNWVSTALRQPASDYVIRSSIIRSGAKRTRPVPLESFLMTKWDWAVSGDGQIFHHYGEAVYDVRNSEKRWTESRSCLIFFTRRTRRQKAIRKKTGD